MGSTRKVTIFILLLLTIGMLGVSGYIGLQLSNTQDAEDSSAAIRGNTSNLASDIGAATNDFMLYNVPKLNCSKFIIQSDLADLADTITVNPTDKTEAGLTQNLYLAFQNDTVPFRIYEVNIDKWCSYRAIIDKFGFFDVDLMVYLHSDADELGNIAFLEKSDLQVNYIKTLIDEQEDDNSLYVFGEDIADPNLCVSALLLKGNLIKYAVVYYRGYGDCNTLKDTNSALMQSLTKRIIDLPKDQTLWKDFDQSN